MASSVAVAVSNGNVGGRVSGNEELVASFMAECDGKNEGKRIWVAKGVATLHGKNLAGNLVISFWWQQRFQNLMADFWAEKIKTHYLTKEALSVHGTCWQKGCEMHFGGKWCKKLMAKVLAKFWATPTRERDVDINRSNLIAPSRGATPTEPMNQTRSQANMIGWHVAFNNPFAGGAKVVSAQRTVVLSRQSAVAFWLPALPAKTKGLFTWKKLGNTL